MSIKALAARLAKAYSKIIKTRPVKVTVNQDKEPGIVARYKDGKPMHINIGVEDASK